jgi:NAD(P)-dependent dehydrogenase (short-subunit alcohol dehydrogenase family)
MGFTAADMPDLSGKTALVTGSAGIAFEVCLQLAKKGARVLMASRSKSKVDSAVALLKAAVPGAQVVGYTLDLAAFSSIDALVEALRRDGVVKLEMLVNNAGVFVPPFSKTEQGFEVQLGTNAVGTIYLTERLLPLLKSGAPSRVVNLSSDMASQAGSMKLQDFGGEKLTTTGFAEYGLSKLYDALYAVALSRRIDTDGITALSVHPGFVATEIQGKADVGSCLGPILRALTSIMAVKTPEGAQSTLYAATADGLQGGQSFGPNRFNQGFTNAWKPSSAAFTPENADAMMQAALEVIKAKGGKL